MAAKSVKSTVTENSSIVELQIRSQLLSLGLQHERYIEANEQILGCCTVSLRDIKRDLTDIEADWLIKRRRSNTKRKHANARRRLLSTDSEESHLSEEEKKEKIDEQKRNDNPSGANSDSCPKETKHFKHFHKRRKIKIVSSEDEEKTILEDDTLSNRQRCERSADASSLSSNTFTINATKIVDKGFTKDVSQKGDRIFSKNVSAKVDKGLTKDVSQKENTHFLKDVSQKVNGVSEQVERGFSEIFPLKEKRGFSKNVFPKKNRDLTKKFAQNVNTDFSKGVSQKTEKSFPRDVSKNVNLGSSKDHRLKQKRILNNVSLKMDRNVAKNFSQVINTNVSKNVSEKVGKGFSKGISVVGRGLLKDVSQKVNQDFSKNETSTSFSSAINVVTSKHVVDEANNKPDVAKNSCSKRIPSILKKVIRIKRSVSESDKYEDNCRKQTLTPITFSNSYIVTDAQDCCVENGICEMASPSSDSGRESCSSSDMPCEMYKQSVWSGYVSRCIYSSSRRINPTSPDKNGLIDSFKNIKNCQMLGKINDASVNIRGLSSVDKNMPKEKLIPSKSYSISKIVSDCLKPRSLVFNKNISSHRLDQEETQLTSTNKKSISYENKSPLKRRISQDLKAVPSTAVTIKRSASLTNDTQKTIDKHTERSISCVKSGTFLPQLVDTSSEGERNLEISSTPKSKFIVTNDRHKDFKSSNSLSKFNSNEKCYDGKLCSNRERKKRRNSKNVEKRSTVDEKVMKTTNKVSVTELGCINTSLKINSDKNDHKHVKKLSIAFSKPEKNRSKIYNSCDIDSDKINGKELKDDDLCKKKSVVSIAGNNCEEQLNKNETKCHGKNDSKEGDSTCDYLSKIDDQTKSKNKDNMLLRISDKSKILRRQSYFWSKADRRMCDVIEDYLKNLTKDSEKHGGVTLCKDSEVKFTNMMKCYRRKYDEFARRLKKKRSIDLFGHDSDEYDECSSEDKEITNEPDLPTILPSSSIQEMCGEEIKSTECINQKEIDVERTVKYAVINSIKNDEPFLIIEPVEIFQYEPIESSTCLQIVPELKNKHDLHIEKSISVLNIDINKDVVSNEQVSPRTCTQKTSRINNTENGKCSIETLRNMFQSYKEVQNRNQSIAHSLNDLLNSGSSLNEPHDDNSRTLATDDSVFTERSQELNEASSDEWVIDESYVDTNSNSNNNETPKNSNNNSAAEVNGPLQDSLPDKLFLNNLNDDVIDRYFPSAFDSNANKDISINCTESDEATVPETSLLSSSSAVETSSAEAEQTLIVATDKNLCTAESENEREQKTCDKMRKEGEDVDKNKDKSVGAEQTVQSISQPLESEDTNQNVEVDDNKNVAIKQENINPVVDAQCEDSVPVAIKQETDTVNIIENSLKMELNQTDTIDTVSTQSKPLIRVRDPRSLGIQYSDSSGLPENALNIEPVPPAEIVIIEEVNRTSNENNSFNIDENTREFIKLISIGNSDDQQIVSAYIARAGECLFNIICLHEAWKKVIDPNKRERGKKLMEREYKKRGLEFVSLVDYYLRDIVMKQSFVLVLYCRLIAFIMHQYKKPIVYLYEAKDIVVLMLKPNKQSSNYELYLKTFTMDRGNFNETVWHIFQGLNFIDHENITSECLERLFKTDEILSDASLRMLVETSRNESINIRSTNYNNGVPSINVDTYVSNETLQTQLNNLERRFSVEATRSDSDLIENNNQANSSVPVVQLPNILFENALPTPQGLVPNASSIQQTSVHNTAQPVRSLLQNLIDTNQSTVLPSGKNGRPSLVALNNESMNSNRIHRIQLQGSNTDQAGQSSDFNTVRSTNGTMSSFKATAGKASNTSKNGAINTNSFENSNVPTLNCSMVTNSLCLDRGSNMCNRSQFIPNAGNFVNIYPNCASNNQSVVNGAILNSSLVGQRSSNNQSVVNGAVLNSSLARQLSSNSQPVVNGAVLNSSLARQLSSNIQPVGNGAILNSSLARQQPSNSQPVVNGAVLDSSLARQLSSNSQPVVNGAVLNSSLARQLSSNSQPVVNGAVLNSSLARQLSSNIQPVENGAILNSSLTRQQSLVVGDYTTSNQQSHEQITSSNNILNSSLNNLLQSRVEYSSLPSSGDKMQLNSAKRARLRPPPLQNLYSRQISAPPALSSQIQQQNSSTVPFEYGNSSQVATQVVGACNNSLVDTSGTGLRTENTVVPAQGAQFMINCAYLPSDTVNNLTNVSTTNEKMESDDFRLWLMETHKRTKLPISELRKMGEEILSMNVKHDKRMVNCNKDPLTEGVHNTNSSPVVQNSQSMLPQVYQLQTSIEPVQCSQQLNQQPLSTVTDINSLPGVTSTLPINNTNSTIDNSINISAPVQMVSNTVNPCATTNANSVCYNEQQLNYNQSLPNYGTESTYNKQFVNLSVSYQNTSISLGEQMENWSTGFVNQNTTNPKTTASTKTNVAKKGAPSTSSRRSSAPVASMDALIPDQISPSYLSY